jgi:16S rRNA (uracil1498-N3)-methyltransferase
MTIGRRTNRGIGLGLRLKSGDPVRLFDGSGGEYAAVLQQAGREMRARVGEFHDLECESPLSITLAQCLSSGDRMDITLQKATELGVCAIQPLQSTRSIVRLDTERMARRQVHWQNVVLSACEQCGRNRVPVVASTVDIADWLASSPKEGTRLMLAPGAPAGLKQINPDGPITLLVGPEGGLSPEEQEMAQTAGFIGVRLGPRVLRTETAPLAALAALQAIWGDL